MHRIVVYFDDIIGSQLMLGKGARDRIVDLDGRFDVRFHRHLGGFTFTDA